MGRAAVHPTACRTPRRTSEAHAKDPNSGPFLCRSSRCRCWARHTQRMHACKRGEGRANGKPVQQASNRIMIHSRGNSELSYNIHKVQCPHMRAVHIHCRSIDCMLRRRNQTSFKLLVCYLKSRGVRHTKLAEPQNVNGVCIPTRNGASCLPHIPQPCYTVTAPNRTCILDRPTLLWPEPAPLPLGTETNGSWYAARAHQSGSWTIPAAQQD
jgi:hypothetical protein